MTVQIDPGVEDVEERVHDFLKKKKKRKEYFEMWTSIILIVILYSLYELMIRDHDILSRLRVEMIYTHVRSGRIWWSSIHDLEWFARLSFQWLIQFVCLLELYDEFWIAEHFWKIYILFALIINVFMSILQNWFYDEVIHRLDLFFSTDIKSQSMEIWLYWTCQWMFFLFFKFPLNPLSKSLITLRVDIEDFTSTATSLFVEHWHEYDPDTESFWFNVLTS